MAEYKSVDSDKIILYMENPNTTISNLEQFLIYDSIVDIFFNSPKIVFTITAITMVASIAILFNFFFKIAAAPFHI